MDSVTSLEQQVCKVYGGHGPRPVPPAEIVRRIEYLAPLVAYLKGHHYVASHIAEEARQRAEAAGEVVVLSNQVWLAKMQRGLATIPPWFVEECCAVLGRPVEEVMGAAWIRRFGVTGRGGVESAPTAAPRLQRPWKSRSGERVERVEDDSSAA